MQKSSATNGWRTMANKQQTAVEWLFSQLPDHLRLSRNGFDMKQQAIQMEREQIINAHLAGQNSAEDDGVDYENEIQYYDKTYSLPDGKPKPKPE